MRVEYYRQFNIWVRENNERALCYRIFERLSDSSYAVQSMDCFTLPIMKDEILQLEKQMRELFIEMDIEERETFYPTIQEAIEMFRKEFTE